MKKALLSLLTEFRFARKRLGGTWYYIVAKDPGGGIVGSTSFWTQDKPGEGYKVIDTENH